MRKLKELPVEPASKPERVTPAPRQGKRKTKSIKPLVGINIVDAFKDKNLLGYSIKDVSTFEPQFTALRALYALPPEPGDLELFQKCTSRVDWPTKPFKRGVWIWGRRTAKSFLSAGVKVWEGCFRDWSPYLTKGERISLFVIASDHAQSRTIMGYIRAMLEAPGLAPFLVKETAEAFELANNVTIEVATCSWKSTRGYTIGGVAGDEVCAWPSEEGQAPASETINALVGGTLTIPDPLILLTTTPMGKRSYLGEVYDACYGDDTNEHTLVFQAPSLLMNKTLDASESGTIATEYRLDPIKAAAEYGAEFRIEMDALITPEALDRATPKEVYERPYDPQYQYLAAIDAASGSTGSKKDSQTLAIWHREGEIAVLDLIREAEPPFDPDAVCADFAATMRRYSISHAWADRWALGYVDSNFLRNDIEILHPEKMDRTQIYASFLPLVNANRVVLLTHKKLRSQLLGLTYYSTHSSRERVDHKPNCHDDLATSCCLGAVQCVSEWTSADDWAFAGTPAGEAQLEKNRMENEALMGRRYLGAGMWA